jgi:hypothetical protein
VKNEPSVVAACCPPRPSIREADAALAAAVTEIRSGDACPSAANPQGDIPTCAEAIMEETMNNRAHGAHIHHRRTPPVVGHTFKSSLWWPAGLFRA